MVEQKNVSFQKWMARQAKQGLQRTGAMSTSAIQKPCVLGPGPWAMATRSSTALTSCSGLQKVSWL